MRKLWSFKGGLKLDGHKAMSMQTPIRQAALPNQLVLPLRQHIGEPAYPIVDVGERVLCGQMIAQAEGFISAPLHASSSGTVVAIEQRPLAHPSGMPGPCIVIDTDGQDEWGELTPHRKNYKRLDPSALRNLIRDAGIVGLGGAGFPTFIKLNPGARKNIDMLILNGAECEPYITCDAMLMQERPREIIEGIIIMRHALQAKQCVIAIEDNKPDAIAIIQAALSAQEKTFIEVVIIPTRYPAGSEKQLIKTLTGMEIPAHALPVQHGIVCHNMGTAVAVGEAVLAGKPLISRIVTVTGHAISQPGNFDTRIGTPMHDMLTQAQVDQTRLDRLIMGGSMMGFEVHDDVSPVLKTTNCLLATVREDVSANEPAMPCIRCGECTKACPAGLLPQQLYWYARAKDFGMAQKYKLFDCIECGCCTYVCPSHIPLVQYYRYAKTEIHAQERDKQKSDIARQRHEFNLYRKERKKQEDEERRRKKKELLNKSAQMDDKQDAIAAALARVEAKKAQAQQDSSE